MEVLDVLGPKGRRHGHQQFKVNNCRSHRTRRSRCCRLVLPAPHPRPVHPSPSARPHDPKPVSDPACARDQLARTHPASPRRVVVARSWSPAPARELRTRRCRPELIRIPPLCGVGAGAPQRRRRGRRGRRPGGHAARREVWWVARLHARSLRSPPSLAPLASPLSPATPARFARHPPRSLRSPPNPLAPLGPAPTRSARPHPLAPLAPPRSDVRVSPLLVSPHPQVMASTPRSKYTKHHLCVHPTSARSTITLPPHNPQIQADQELHLPTPCKAATLTGSARLGLPTK